MMVGVANTRLSLKYARDFLSRINFARFPYFMVFRLCLIQEQSIDVLFSQFGSIVAKIGAAQFPLLCFQFSLLITYVMFDSE